MTLIDGILPRPRLLEHDAIDLAASPVQVWERVRHGNLAGRWWIRALFGLRTLPERFGRERAEFTARIDDLASSSADEPGFQILAEDPPREVVIGAIGKVWKTEIPFVYVPSADAFTAFGTPGFVKVAWALRVSPRGEQDARLELEVRVDATDDEAWRSFKSYFRVIGIGSHLIRRAVLSDLASELGTPEAREPERSLPGDDLILDARGQLTHGITIEAPPSRIWPWLLQMGCGRAGFYSIDLLDNGGVPSARDVHPELMDLRVGDMIAATPEAKNHFEVLRIQRERVLVLGGLFDTERGEQRRFGEARPREFWQVTWAFVLEPLDDRTTRLHVRVRGSFSEAMRWHASWVMPVHGLMEHSQLRHLAERAEGRLSRDSLHDRLEGFRGAAIAAGALLTPFLRRRRDHWGLDEPLAARAYPGDALVPVPTWGWTHAVEIEAPAAEVWPWIAQVGADRGGFYSYQWLENIAGCNLVNAERVHPEWAVEEGGLLVLHPRMRAFQIVEVIEPRHFVAYAPPNDRAIRTGGPWSSASWLFFLEPLGETRCRLISRFRSTCSADLKTRLKMGPTILEPVGFAMDRRMLLGVKERIERRPLRSH
jgi:hypothetical protein